MSESQKQSNNIAFYTNKFLFHRGIFRKLEKVDKNKISNIAFINFLLYS